MTKLILDYSNWRSGGSEGSPVTENIVGKGSTQMLNDEGFMCCLGQFAPQLNCDVKFEGMRGTGEPCDNGLIKLLTINDDDDGIVENTQLSTDAMDINDDNETTPEKKIVLLKALFATNNCEIEVINKP